MSFQYQAGVAGVQAGGVAVGGSGRAMVGGVGGVGVGGVGVGGVGVGGARVVGGGVVGGGGMGVGPGVGVGVGGGASCGTAENCVAACVCAPPPGPAVMTFVGQGVGDYSTETNYKYVGMGRGDLAMVAPQRLIWGRVACVSISLAVLLILVILLWPHPFTTTTTTFVPHWTTTPPPHHGECTFWGDPHLKTFDGSRPSFYGAGEAWVIKSSTISIQARYMGTKYTKGLAATNAIVVGGSFMQGHTIEVGTLESRVLLIDNQPALQSFGTVHVAAGITVTYNQAGHLVDAAAGVWSKHVVHMELPSGVRVTVFRWNNYIDLRITMPGGHHIDGACGNFNGNPADDTTEAIQQRVGARVGPGDLLFRSRATVHISATEQALLASPQCRAKYTTAYAACQAELPGAHKSAMDACILDHCYGSNEHTLRYAKGMGL